MAEEQELSGRMVLVGLAFMAATGVGAIYILLSPVKRPPAPQPQPRRQAAAAPAAPQPKSSVFDSARSAQEAASGLATRQAPAREIGTYASSSSPKPFMGDQSQPQEKPAEQKPEARPAAPAQPQAAASDESLSEKENAALAQAAGGWSDQAAPKIGAASPLLVKAVEKLFDYPKVIKFLLGNKLVIDGYMSSKFKKKNCSDPQALANYLSNPNAPGGVRLFMDAFAAGFRRPDALNAVLGSALTNTVLTQCPAVTAMTKSPEMVGQIARDNPEVLMMLANPVLARALAQNPAVLGVVGDFQKTGEAAMPQLPAGLLLGPNKR